MIEKEIAKWVLFNLSPEDNEFIIEKQYINGVNKELAPMGLSAHYVDGTTYVWIEDNELFLKALKDEYRQKQDN